MLHVVKNILFLKGINQFFDQEYLKKRRFKKLLKHAFHHSKFYRDLYTSHGIKEHHLDEVSITDLPIVTKSLLMENYDNVLTVNDLSRSKIEQYLYSISDAQYGKFYLDKYMILHTSGSSGVVGYFVYGKREWDMLMALAVTRVSRVKPKLNGDKYRIVFVGAIGGNYAGSSLVRSCPTFLYDNTLIPIHKHPDEIFEILNQIQPEILSGYGSSMPMIAEAQLEGKINIKPKYLHSSGEALTKKGYELTKEAWGFYPSNFYACTESLCMGIQWSPHEEFELFNDFNVFEIVDENRKEVGLNQEGNLILTNLYNYTQPLIRYQMNDILEKGSEERNEKGYLKIKSINGRKEKTMEFVNREGKKIKIHHNLMLGFLSPGVHQYQFVQTSPNELLLKVKLVRHDEELVRQAKARVDELIANHDLQDCVKSKVEVVKEFNINAKTGKFVVVNPYEELKAA